MTSIAVFVIFVLSVISVMVVDLLAAVDLDVAATHAVHGAARLPAGER